MRSNDRSDALDLDRDLPTTAADVAALRAARPLGRLDLTAYLEFLAHIPDAGGAERRMARREAADAPFELSH